MAEDIIVSIVCNTYNHEKYIRDALQSFVSQKTNFKFEVLVHDDASTDNTANIIREYEEKYHDIIKPIYQIENQHSKGINISLQYQYSRAKGKYIAFCEGDDYWIDPLKLQKQVDAMDNHPEIDMCAHAAVIVDANNKKEIGKILPAKDDTVLSTKSVISGGGGFVATASLLFRSELNDKIPKFRECLSLDYTLQIHGALRGGILYLSDFMSAYRYLSMDSWTVKQNTRFDKKWETFKKMIDMLNILNAETDYKYIQEITRKLMIDFSSFYNDLLGNNIKLSID